ncbi:putative glycosyltransferase [Anaerolineae bacterium]|nr:putative glycosyltransferase [Anaerolineae bacterium]
MRCPTLDELPPPTLGKTGFPWTRESARTSNVDLSRITIVTPSFNQAAFLEETIRSVLLQRYPNLEYIVIDGGSTDGSVEIIRKYAPWLTYWISEPDRGQAHAINKGLRVSTGEWMGWLNSDDYLLPNALHRISHFYSMSSKVEIVCGFRREVDQHDNRIGVRVYFKPDRFSLSRVCYIAQEATFWRRSVWQKIGELDEILQYALDYDYWQRMLAAQYEFYLLPCFIGVLRKHADAKGSMFATTRTVELARIYSRYLNTSKNEAELRHEVNPVYWYRSRLLTGLGCLGVLNSPRLAQWIVSQLTLPSSQIPNPNMDF